MPTAVEQIMWTAIPNGIVTADDVASLQVSVCVSPTLSGGTLTTGAPSTGTLADFLDFQSWPDVMLREGHIRLTFTDTSGSTLGAHVVAMPTASTSVLNNPLWEALFTTSVQYSARDAAESTFATTPVVSYPSDQIANFLQTTYTSLATSSPTSYPSTDTLAGSYGGLGYAGNSDQRERLNSLWSDLATMRTAQAPTGAPAPYANDWSALSVEYWMAAARYYHLPPLYKAPPSLNTPPAPALPTVDFHRALTFVNQHSALQRALGLVIDVTIPIDDVTFGTSVSDFFIQAEPSNVDGAPFAGTSDATYTPILPRVQCDASSSVFRAHAAGTAPFGTVQIANRQLTLGDPSSFAVYEIDVDGGALKTAQFADNLKLAQDPQSGTPDSANGAAPDTPTAYAPPSLRSLGLTVAAVNRGLAFAAAVQRGASLASSTSPSSPPDLTAEDLVTGYILDVYDSTTKSWHSTAMRDITYSVTSPAITIPVPGDEPALDSPARSQKDPQTGSNAQFNVPANIIRWTGWSNAVQRPGSALADSGAASTGAGSGPFSQLQMTGANGAPLPTPSAGTLPRLRYGVGYALRARVVDIANNKLALTDPTLATLGDSANVIWPAGTSAAGAGLSVFGRHEPIGAPDIYTFNPSPVLGESLKRLVIRDIDSSPSSSRAFAPNRVAEAFCELHGVFDTATGGTLDPSAYNVITPAEAARYPALGSTPPNSDVTDPSHFDLTGAVPFLPDPLQKGGVLLVIDGALAGSTVPFDFNAGGSARWPGYEPFGLTLLPGSSAAANVDETARQINFALTPGDTFGLQLSSTIAAQDLTKFGLSWWIFDFYKGSVPTALGDSIIQGLTWAFTPWTLLELVHAVQRPLLSPTLAFMYVDRVIGWTRASVGGDITYSPKSTAHTELLASWSDPVDGGTGTAVPQGPGSPDPTPVPRQASVYTISSSLAQQASETDRFIGNHELFDTKYHRITYTGLATSRFTEHYQGSTSLSVPSAGTAVALTLPGKGNLGLEDKSVTVTDSSGNVYAENTAFTIDATAGTITFLAAGPAAGTTVAIEFLPSVSVLSNAVTLDILSTARPISLDIAAIVPIYAWSKLQPSGSKTSARTPSALRVFFERPWWSSGTGELLGVITYPPAEHESDAVPIPKDYQPYVSDWGLDPVFKGGALPSRHPILETFPKRVADGTSLTIDERAGVLVNAAGHDVSYDEARELWYVDIEVDFGKAYTPMIRLALARYQPKSLAGVELGRIVLADVMSLEPGRIVSIVRKSRTEIASVTLAGYSYSVDGDRSDTGPGVAELVVEQRVSGIHDDVVGWEPAKDATGAVIGRLMPGHTLHSGVTEWLARDIKIPSSGGPYRLYIAQYEIVPRDNRSGKITDAVTPSVGQRLLYQDIIPL